MVLGKTPSKVKSSKSERITGVRYIHVKTPQETSNRKGTVYQISEPSLHYTEKGHSGREMDYGSFNTKQIHKVSKIPHANNERSPVASSKRLLVCSSGPQRWILAPPCVPSEKALSRFSVQRSTMAVSCNAVRPKYCTTTFHKSHGSHGQSNGSRRHIRAHFSGRHANCCANKRCMLGSHEQSTINIGVLRLDNKRKQVSQTPSTDIRLARSSHKPPKTHSVYQRVDHGRTPSTFEIRNSVEILHKTETNATSRSGQLGRSNQSNLSLDVVKNKSTTKSIQEGKIGCPNNPLQRHETQPSQMASHTSGPTTTGQPITQPYYSNRRFTQRLGFPNQLGTFSRNFRSNHVLLHKHVRTTYDMVRLVNGGKQRPSDPNSLRQLGSYSCNKTRHFDGISPVNDCGIDLATSGVNELDTTCAPHSRSVQCHSRSVEQECSPVNGMVPSRTCFQEYPEEEPQASNRLICDSTKPSASDIHLTLSRRVSNSSGCNGDIMGRMGSLIPLSPVNPDFEGFTEDVQLTIRERSSSHARDTVQTMVHGFESPQNTIDSPISSPSTSSSEQIGHITCSYQTTRLEIIKAAYDKEFPDCQQAVTLMATPIRNVSINEYEKKWRAFMSFLRTNNIPFQDISLTSVIKFLAFLFHSKNLKPKTVAQYRTALAKPLRTYFGIDLIVPPVSDLLKSICLQRPSVPVSAPSWSLNKVLTYLDELPAPLSPVMLLRKTAFLLLLTTGWRISELSACVRDPEFCYFSGNITLNIRPHPSFLAKNENPQKRWSVKEIKTLRLQDGSVSKLCPVESTRDYLQRTQPANKGPLFLTPNNHSKGLTIHKLSKHICQLILMADHVTRGRVKAHDVRKYASSYAFLNTMLVGELVSAMNWSSPVTFFKFYFTQTEPLRRPVSLPVLNQ